MDYYRISSNFISWKKEYNYNYLSIIENSNVSIIYDIIQEKDDISKAEFIELLQTNNSKETASIFENISDKIFASIIIKYLRSRI